MNDTANTDHAEMQVAFLEKNTKNSVATAQLLGAGYKQKVALPESISCVMVAGRVAARTLSIKEVGGNGFTFVAKEVASFGVRVAQLRCMVTQLRNYYKFPLWLDKKNSIYCLTLGGLKPPPLGGSFSIDSAKCGP